MPVWERHAFFVKHAIGMEVHADAVDSLAEAKKTPVCFSICRYIFFKDKIDID